MLLQLAFELLTGIFERYSRGEPEVFKCGRELAVLHDDLIVVRGGGLRLRAEPDQIRIGDVVRATETDFRLVECFDATTNACSLSPACRLKHLFDDALAGYFKALDGATLADMTQGPTLPRSRTIAPPASRRRALGAGPTEARRVARPRSGA